MVTGATMESDDPRSRVGERSGAARRALARRAAASATLATSLLVTGAACTPASPAPEPTATTTSTPQPTATPPPTPAAEATPPPVRDALEEWTVIAGPSQELSTLVSVSDGQFVAILGGEDQSIAIFTDGHRDQLAAPPGFIVQDVLQVAGQVVFGATNEVDPAYRLYRWTPGQASAEILLESAGADSYWSEAASWGEDLYLTMAVDDTLCVTRWDVTEPDPAATAQPIACADTGQRLGWLSVQDATVSYLVVDDAGGCARLMTVSLPDGEPELARTDGCIGRAIASGDLIAWDRMPEGSDDVPMDWFDVPLSARAGDEVVSLGRATGGSEAICDGALYWQTARVSGTPVEVRRWSPGGDIEVVYRSPDRDRLDAYSTSRPICHHGMLGLQRFGWWADTGEEFLATGTWTWTADVAPAATRPAD